MSDKAIKKTSEVVYASHQKWGGTYLIVVEDSADFEIALDYTSKMASVNKCRLGLLYVIEEPGFSHWRGVQNLMVCEQRKRAEELINEACFKIVERGGALPSIYIESGRKIDVVTRVIRDDDNVSLLMLRAGTSGGGPGPLVSHFTRKGLSHVRVPVMIIPDHVYL